MSYLLFVARSEILDVLIIDVILSFLVLHFVWAESQRQMAKGIMYYLNIKQTILPPNLRLI